jgi:hypothetical protein
MIRISADVQMTSPTPNWAVWDCRLFDAFVHPFLAHFTRDDGKFIWNDEWGGGSPDDYYEPFFNWQLVYLMGGRRSAPPRRSSMGGGNGAADVDGYGE